jgi:dihydroorotase-like cyclic amidohydrolase
MPEPMLFTGARVLDPATGRDDVTDVLVADGRIEEVRAGVDAGGAEVIDCTGLVLTT